MDKYQNRYRIPSARLQNWDYGANGAYFITICTENRDHFFGEIFGGVMKLNELGLLAHEYWAEIPCRFPFVALGNFVVMPNHIHGILIIDKLTHPGLPVETLQCNVSTNADKCKNEKMAKISPKPGSVSTVVRSYKSVVSKNARLIHAGFGWQTRFYDHIIRDAQSFETIQNYIANNPANWERDKFYG